MKYLERFSFLSYRRRHRIKYFVIIPLCLIAIVSALTLILYGFDYLSSKHYAAKLRTAYYEAVIPQPTAESNLSAVVEPIDAAATSVPLDVVSATEAPLSKSISATVAHTINSTYPDNPYRIMDSGLKTLRQQNNDIIGWLTIDGIVDEAVVQRDNTYYLRRDYRGYHNTNGALFLDENCSLTNRPPIYIIYGHNMKSGLMFGCLRNWETQSFYHKNPFIHFKSLYEEGVYVIFAVGILDNEVLNLALYAYTYKTAIMKKSAIGSFIMQAVNRSIYNNVLDISPDDQFLMLVTCIDDDDKRRVLVARKLRADEKQNDVLRVISRNRYR